MICKFILIISLFINLTFSKFPNAIGYNGMVVNSIINILHKLV